MTSEMRILSDFGLFVVDETCINDRVAVVFIFRQNNNNNTKINKKDVYKVEGDLSIVVIITSRGKATQDRNSLEFIYYGNEGRKI